MRSAIGKGQLQTAISAISCFIYQNSNPAVRGYGNCPRRAARRAPTPGISPLRPLAAAAHRSANAALCVGLAEHRHRHDLALGLGLRHRPPHSERAIAAVGKDPLDRLDLRGHGRLVSDARSPGLVA